MEAHPTISDDLPHRIITGSVKIRSDIRHFTQSGVVFDDGTLLDVDVVILATGYDYKFKVEREIKISFACRPKPSSNHDPDSLIKF